jgi:hypothetical protein
MTDQPWGVDANNNTLDHPGAQDPTTQAGRRSDLGQSFTDDGSGTPSGL